MPLKVPFFKSGLDYLSKQQQTDQIWQDLKPISINISLQGICEIQEEQSAISEGVCSYEGLEWDLWS